MRSRSRIEKRGAAAVPPAMKFLLPASLAFFLVLTSCTSLPIALRDRDRENEEKRLAIVRYARSLLGKKDLAKESPDFRNDCSGLVLGVYGGTGYPLELDHGRRSRTVSDAMYRALHERGLTYVRFRPRPADLVFFKGTTGKNSDLVTHVGIVDGILKDGTVVIVHYASGSVSELRMNLLYPSVHKNGDGDVMNDFLRRKLSQSREGEKLLSGELFFSFGDALSYALAEKPHIVFE
jgi:hypothetical protein